MKRIGLTGGIACGKSEVALILRARGVPVIDADQIARDVVAPGQPALHEIAQRFGSGVLLPDGTLDRAKLGALVVADADARRGLEAITHPRIIQAALDRLSAIEAAGTPAAVVEAALMMETGSWRAYDAVMVVRCANGTQVRRLMERKGVGEDEARRWIQAQMPIEEKARLASVVIDNDGSREELTRAVVEAWARVVPVTPGAAASPHRG